jgi:TonB family protein
MKANVNLKSKTKNSFIYFQLGLIGTMLVVLFVLELQFENVAREIKMFTLNGTIEEPIYSDYEIIKEVKIEQSKTVQKPVVKIPKDITELDVKKDDEVIKETDIKTQDDVVPTDAKETKNNVVVTPNEGEKNTKAENRTIFNVEQLPMFPQCKGLSRAEQKACFDEQLLKAVLRNLQYPDVDLRRGNQGTALIEFVIDENGYITNVKAVENKRATETMQEAAEKAVQKLPKLIPAKQGKENVRIKYSIPISFRIQ